LQSSQPAAMASSLAFLLYCAVIAKSDNLFLDGSATVNRSNASPFLNIFHRAPEYLEGCSAVFTKKRVRLRAKLEQIKLHQKQARFL
jgi:hypothetical protein